MTILGALCRRILFQAATRWHTAKQTEQSAISGWCASIGLPEMQFDQLLVVVRRSVHTAPKKVQTLAETRPGEITIMHFLRTPTEEMSTDRHVPQVQPAKPFFPRGVRAARTRNNLRTIYSSKCNLRPHGENEMGASVTLAMAWKRTSLSPDGEFLPSQKAHTVDVKKAQLCVVLRHIRRRATARTLQFYQQRCSWCWCEAHDSFALGVKWCESSQSRKVLCARGRLCAGGIAECNRIDRN